MEIHTDRKALTQSISVYYVDNLRSLNTQNAISGKSKLVVLC